MQVSYEERALLRDSIRRLLQQHWPVERAVELQLQAQAISEIWRLFAEQGLTALGTAVEEGGLSEILLVQEELGRAACPAPLAEATIANLLLWPVRNRAQVLNGLFEQLHGGDAILALACRMGEEGSEDCDYRDGCLNGRVSFVEHARWAMHLLVVVDGGLALVSRNVGTTISDTPGLSAPPLCGITFESTPAEFIELDEQTLTDCARLMRLQLAARALGAARRGYDLVVEHAHERRQFGVPIGSFQAIQHKLADCLIDLDGTRLSLEHSAGQFDRHSGDWRVFGAAACAFANTALRRTVLEFHHTFGAIGFSEEHELPRHFRRIHGDLARLGGVHRAREDLAAYLLDTNADALPAFDLGAQANRFREEVRAFLEEHWNECHREEARQLPPGDREWNPDFSRKLYEKGWVGLSWPKEYGGEDRSPLERAVFVEEMAYADAPTTAHVCAVELIAPAIIAFGTAEQKCEWLPAIQRGDITCCLGYSEPDAGSDLAGLRTRAVKDGDHWVINGQKLWTTTGEKASHVWLAVRTDPDAKSKHAGISVLLVPLNTPGITVQPSMAMYGHTFCTVFYDNVCVPDSALVGGVNNGWQVITHALASERILMGGRVAVLRGYFRELIAYLKYTEMRADSLIRDRIGCLAADIEVARQFALRSVIMTEQGKVPIHEAAMSKVFYGELMERTLEAAIDLLGSAATLSNDAASAPLHGTSEQLLRTSIMMVVGGGTAEIQRNIIAQRGVGLPR